MLMTINELKRCGNVPVRSGNWWILVGWLCMFVCLMGSSDEFAAPLCVTCLLAQHCRAYHHFDCFSGADWKWKLLAPEHNNHDTLWWITYEGCGMTQCSIFSPAHSGSRIYWEFNYNCSKPTHIGKAVAVHLPKPSINRLPAGCGSPSNILYIYIDYICPLQFLLITWLFRTVINNRHKTFSACQQSLASQLQIAFVIRNTLIRQNQAGIKIISVWLFLLSFHQVYTNFSRVLIILCQKSEILLYIYIYLFSAAILFWRLWWRATAAR